MNKIYGFLLVSFLFSPIYLARGGGISVDAGLTPAQDRFIFRTQFRHMSMENAMMRNNTRMVPLVLAYGITPGFSVMTRGVYVSRSSDATGTGNSGFNDPFLLTKFRLYRKNTAKYVIGIAPHVASNIPVGDRDISNRTWNPEIGLNMSFRPRFMAFDLSTSYTFVDVTDKTLQSKWGEFSLNMAFSAQIPLETRTSTAISPVVETTYIREMHEADMASNEVLFVSPGISFTVSSLVLEALVQFPVYQSPTGGEVMEWNSRSIVGVKYMF